jgi:hypothetical protein
VAAAAGLAPVREIARAKSLSGFSKKRQLNHATGRVIVDTKTTWTTCATDPPCGRGMKARPRLVPREYIATE